MWPIKAQCILLHTSPGKMIQLFTRIDPEADTVNAEGLTRTYGAHCLLKWSTTMKIEWYLQHLYVSCLDWVKHVRYELSVASSGCLNMYLLTVSLNTNWHWTLNSVSHLFSQIEIDFYMWHLSQSCLNNVTQKKDIVKKTMHRTVLFSYLMLLHMCSCRKHFKYSSSSKITLQSQGWKNKFALAGMAKKPKAKSFLWN